MSTPVTRETTACSTSWPEHAPKRRRSDVGQLQPPFEAAPHPDLGNAETSLTTKVRMHNRFRDLHERWKSASTARRNRLPHLLRQTIDPARWGRRFRLPFPWPQSMVGI